MIFESAYAQLVSSPEVIFSDKSLYSAFPSIAKDPKTNELFLSFRVAKQRNELTHVDKTAHVKLWRSTDKGVSWKQFAVIAQPNNSIQEASLFMTPESTLLAHTYQWDKLSTSKNSFNQFTNNSDDKFGLYGGRIFQYNLKDKKWTQGRLPGIPQNYATLNNRPVPSFNRGTTAMDKNGRLYMASYVFDSPAPSRKFSTYLIVSDDKGLSWKVQSLIASHSTASLNETSIYITPKNTVIAFIRMENGGERNLAIARSFDMGKNFQPLEITNVVGQPFNALKMVDDKILLTYGHRDYPYGIRSLVLNAEGTNINTAKEIILRSDGDRADIGYPWAVHLENNTYLVVYYMRHNGVTSILKQTITF